MALGGPVIFCFMVEDFYSGRFIVAVPLLLTLGLLIATYLYTKKPIGPAKELIAYNLLLAAFISLIGFVLWYIIAVEGHLSRTQWTYIYPILASFAMGRKLGFLWSIGFFLSVFLMTHSSGPFVHQDIQASLSEALMKRYYLAFLLVMGGIYFIERSGQKDRQTIMKSRNELAHSEKRSKDAYERLQTETEERKLAEEALRKAHNELEKRVQERTEELAEAKEKAESANMAKSEFLANMSHELRTPLNHIIGFTEMVVDKRIGSLNEDQSSYLNDVLYSSKHLLSLINDILDLSKVEAGKLVIEPSDVNLNTLLENSLIIVKEKALKHGLELSLDMDGIPEIIRADERKIKQIMYNLLSNAVKFTPDGGKVSVMANLRSKADIKKVGSMNHASFSGETTGFVEISVRDSGIGLVAEDLERIFNVFEQVEQSASRRFQGTGLGLALTKKLVELHDGKIWAESDGYGKGSCFRFAIPVSHE